MNRMGTWIWPAVNVAFVATAGLCAFLYVPIAVWARSSNGLFVVLSVLAAALLVRLARPSPFSNPDVFTDENVERYFEALLSVAHRLAVILAAAALAVAILIVIVVMSSMPLPPPATPPNLPDLDAIISGLFCGLLGFLSLRICSVIVGDLGFIRLQGRIIRDSRKQKATAAAVKIVNQPTAWKSSGTYG